MKLFMDLDKIQTRVENKNTLDLKLEEEIKTLTNNQIPNNLIDIFNYFYKNGDGNIEKVLKIDRDSIKLDSILKTFNDIKQQIINSEDIIKDFDFKAYQKLKKIHIERIYFQKTTYLLHDNENIDEIFNSLKELKSMALFKMFIKEDNKIVSYSSTFGLWVINDNFFFRLAESRVNERVRTTFTLRQLKYPSKMQNMQKINYPIYEDTNHLFKNQKIDRIYKLTQQRDGSLKADDNSLFILKYHFLDKLNESDLKEIANRQIALFKVTKESSHISKKDATTKDVKQMCKQNEKELHTKYNDLEDTKLSQKLIEIKKNNIENFLKQKESDLIKQHEIELTKLKEEIYIAKESQDRVKNEFLNALVNGASIDETISMLKASKYNQTTINIVLEELKADIISTDLKDKIIESKQRNIDKLISNNEFLKKEIDENQNILKEINSNLKLSIETISKLKTSIEQKNIDIIDLQNEIEELNTQNSLLESELESINEKTEKKPKRKIKRVIHVKKTKPKK